MPPPESTPAQRGQLRQNGLVQIEQVQRMPGLEQVARHRCAHVAQADKCNLHGRIPKSAQVDGGVDAIVDRVVVEPAAGDGLGLGVELHHLLAVRAEVAELGTTGTGEAEERHRHRDRDVDADLAYIDFTLELTRRRTALGEQAGAVFQLHRLTRVETRRSWPVRQTSRAVLYPNQNRHQPLV